MGIDEELDEYGPTREMDDGELLALIRQTIRDAEELEIGPDDFREEDPSTAVPVPIYNDAATRPNLA